MLHAIARESDSLHANNIALLRARDPGRALDHVMAIATCQMSHSCNLLASRIAALGQVVIKFDRDIAGIGIGSLAELGLRSQTLTILMLLDELYDATRDDVSAYQDLFVGRFRTIEDVIAFLFDALSSINERWLPYRITRHAPDVAHAARTIDAAHASLYRSGIRDAQRAMASLGDDPDLAHFLRTGSERNDAPQVSRACVQLAEILTVALTREPDPVLFLAAAVLEPEELFDLSDGHGDWVATRKARL